MNAAYRLARRMVGDRRAQVLAQVRRGAYQHEHVMLVKVAYAGYLSARRQNGKLLMLSAYNLKLI